MDWRILAFITIVSWGGYAVILKAVGSRIPWQLSLLWFVIGYAACILVFCLVALPNSKLRILHPNLFWPLFAGVLCGIGGIAFFKAIPMVAGSVFLPLTGLYVVVTAVGCLIFLHEPFSLRVLAGIACATVAVMLLGK